MPQPDSAASSVREKYEKGLSSIRDRCQDYWLNYAFLEGRQWLHVDPMTARISRMQDDPDRVRATINRMGNATRALMAKYMQRPLTFEVLPNAATDSAAKGAEVGEAILESLRVAHDWENIRYTNGMSTWKGGTAAICVDWDKNSGRHLFNRSVGPDQQEPVHEGDSRETPLSIAEFVCEPGVRDGEKGRFWIKAQALPPEEVQAMFKLDKTPKPDAMAGLSSMAAGAAAGEQPGSQAQRPDLTLVLTYYERPNPLTPKGKVLAVVDNKVVDGPKPWPFPWTDRLNLVITHETPDETRWTGRTVLSDGRYIQTALNHAKSNILEHLKAAGNARLLVPANEYEVMRDASDMAGEMIPVQDMDQKPEWCAPAPLPQWVIDEPANLANEMDDQLGVHDISRGVAGVNAPDSGYGISLLAENDTSPVMNMLSGAARKWAILGTMVLKLYEANCTTTRETTIQPGQRYASPQTLKWTGNSLAGQTNVSIPAEAILPRSRAAMQAMADNLLKMGAIQGPSQYYKIAELPGQRQILAATNPDENRARTENYYLSQGQHPSVQPFHNHGVHITTHIEEMNNMDWDRAPVSIRDAYMLHLQQHQTLASEAAGRADQRAMMSPNLAAAPTADGTPPMVMPEGGMPPQAPGGMPPGQEPGMTDTLPVDPAEIAKLENL